MVTVAEHVFSRSPTIISRDTNEHGERNFAAVGLSLSKTLLVCVVQLSIAFTGHHPHDLHMHIRQGCCTGNRRQKQAGVSPSTVSLSARILKYALSSFLGLFWMS